MLTAGVHKSAEELYFLTLPSKSKQIISLALIFAVSLKHSTTLCFSLFDIFSRHCHSKMHIVVVVMLHVVLKEQY